ncbi:c-type cytochrome [Mariniradius sediminis]|uniref:Cytochrome c n=1 Tax=Mariniradius sediminis TaxID=2909237 RepID=A0ABS9BPG9_9BACT|nr:cytochrome c [Mariniradius sediminis]MCF1749943.1 cytochrome c [Mariniradius sediminis]
MREVFLYLLFAGFLISCSANNDKKKGTLADITDTKVLQYAIQGKILYEQHCANCHQKDGSGLGKLIPPIKNSDYFLADKGRTARIIKYGQTGPITVNGIEYNEAMPANPKLTDLEIAQLMTYLYNIWGAKEGVIDASQAGQYLKH